jgi:ssDNA-binding replication factor A large subunit
VPSKKELYKLVKDLISEEEFETSIKGKMDQWNELIDEDAAALLIVDEFGRKKMRFRKVSEVEEGVVNLKARVEEIGELREITTRRGPGRVVNIKLSDETGRCRLALWDSDIELIGKLGIEEGKTLRIVNGYAKITRFGIDVSKGRGGVIEVD